MLFRLAILRCSVMDVPMQARYGEEQSGLSVVQTLFTFPFLHARNAIKRILYNYFIRGFSAASLSLMLGLAFFVFGVVFGGLAWWESARTGVAATAGTVMLSAFPLLVGLQLVLHFLHHDVVSEPVRPVHRLLSKSLRGVSNR